MGRNMTDAEINLAIAKIEYPETNNLELWVDQNMVDYVNNWSDIGPIIDREGLNITIDKTNKVWIAWTWDSSIDVRADTPTKAAALCYLKMKEVNNDDC
jgi:hypothetical protein